MIEKMKKLSLLLFHAERETALARLQEFGVVHLDIEQGKFSKRIESLIEERSLYTRALDILKNHIKNSSLPAVSPISAHEACSRIIEQADLIDKNTQRCEILKKEALQLEPWGNFSWEKIQKCRVAGINIYFFSVSARDYEKTDFTAEIYKNITIEKINQTGSTLFCAAFTRSAVVLPFEQTRLPEKTAAEINSEMRNLEKQNQDAVQKIISLAPCRAILQKAAVQIDDSLFFEKAQVSLSSKSEGSIYYIQGWIPAPCEKDVLAFLDAAKFAYIIEEPLKTDIIPVKLKNNAFTRLYEVITRLFSLPHYSEIDPTPFFAPFFTFFYGMCLGDIGYGLLLFIPALIMIFKASDKMRPIFVLGLFMAAATILNGFFLNSFFGASLFSSDGGTGIIDSPSRLTFLSSYVKDSKTVFPAISFAILIGGIQISLGMLMQFFNRLRNDTIFHALVPVSQLVMFSGLIIWVASTGFLGINEFSIGNIQIGRMLEVLQAKTYLYSLNISGLDFQINYFLGFGFLMLIIFTILMPGGDGLSKAIGIYNTVTGFLADGLSYLRLFALGLAGGLLGLAFNNIAFMLIRTPEGTLNFKTPLAAATVIILLFGHFLNFALSALGAYVHSVRLIFVEFYKNVDFKGGAKPYTPFAKTAKN